MPNRQISELNDSQMEAIVTLKYFRNARDLLLKLGDIPRMFPSCFIFSHLTYLDQSRASKNI